MENQNINSAEGAQENVVSNSPQINPFNPVKGEKYIDVVKGITSGLQFLDLEALSKESGLELKMYDDPEKYAETFKGMDPEKLSSIHSEVSQMFDEYKRGNFDKNSSTIGVIPDYEVTKSLGGFRYSSYDLKKGSKLGIQTSYGFSQFLTEEGVAQVNNIVYDKETGVFTDIKTAQKNGKALVLRESNDPTNPDYYFEARDWDEDLRAEQLYSLFGASSLKKSNPFVSMGKGAWSATAPAVLKALGYIVDKPVDLYEGISNLITEGEFRVETDGRTDRFGNLASNYSRAMVHRNQDEMQGAFDNWQSFMYAFGDGLTQLATMRGISGAAFYGLKGLGVGAMRAQAIASPTGLMHAAANMAATTDEVMAEVGYSEEVRAGLFIPLMATVFAAEKLIGTNNLTKFLQSEKKILAKELKETGFEIAKQAGKKNLKEVGDKTLSSKMKDLVLRSGARLNEYANKHGGIAAGMAAGAREEMLEETTEAVIEFGIKKMGDYFMRESARRTKEYYTGALFDARDNSIEYINGNKEYLDSEEFNAAYKDYNQALDILERGEGQFLETFSDLIGDIKESAGIGGIVGGLAVPMFNRAAYKNGQNKKRVLYTNSIKMAIDPNHEKTVRAQISEMVKEGYFGPTDIDVDGNKTSESKKRSAAEEYAEQFFNELKANADLASSYGITDAAVLRANAGEVNMLVPLFEANLKKDELKKQLDEIEAQTELSEDEKESLRADIIQKLSEVDKTINEYAVPENNTYSKAYNDRVKTLETSRAITDDIIQGAYNNNARKKARTVFLKMAEQKKIRDKAQKAIDGYEAQGNEDNLTDREKILYERRKAQLEKANAEINRLDKKYKDFNSKAEKRIDKMKNSKEYWNHFEALSTNQKAYGDYLDFINNDLDGLIEAVNRAKDNIQREVQERTDLAVSLLQEISDNAGKLKDTEAWKKGKGFSKDSNVRALIDSIMKNFSVLNNLSLKDGSVSLSQKSELEGLIANINTEFLGSFSEKLNNLSQSDFFEWSGEARSAFESLHNIETSINKEGETYESRIAEKRERVEAAKESLEKLKADGRDRATDPDYNQMLEEREAFIAVTEKEIAELESYAENEFDDEWFQENARSFMQHVKENKWNFEEAFENMKDDAIAEEEFARSQIDWINKLQENLDEISEGVKFGSINLDHITRDSLNDASNNDWYMLYISDIESEVAALEKMADSGKVADPESILNDLFKLEEKIEARIHNLVVQGVALSHLNNDKAKRDHLTKNTDYPLDKETSDMLYSSLMNYREHRLRAVALKMAALAGNRTIYQIKANAKHLEFQRLSLVHILENVGSEVSKEFQDAVSKLTPIEWDSKDADVISESIKKNEKLMIIAKDELYKHQKRLIKDGAVKRMFIKNGKFIMNNNRPVTYSSVLDQESISFMEDDFNPAESISKNGKVGYVYFMAFLEESFGARASDLYKAELEILKSQEGTDSKVASHEQTMAIRQIVGFMSSGGSKVSDIAIDAVLEHLRINDTKQKQKTIDNVIKTRNAILKNALFMRGNAGVGKTNVMLPMALQLYMRLNNKKKIKVKLIDPTKDKDLSSRIAELNESLPEGYSIEFEVIDRDQFITKKINDDHDFVIVDEASLLDNSDLNHIKEHNSSKPILFLGDESQMQSLTETMPYSAASKRMARSTPVTMSYRTNVFQVFDLREAFKDVIINYNNETQYPKLYKEQHGDSLYGGWYYSSLSDINNAFLDSKSKDKALVFLTHEDVDNFYKKNKANWSQYKGKVYALESLLKAKEKHIIDGDEIISIQGMGVDEVYLHIDFENISAENKSLRGRAGLTGVTRAKNFVAIVGSQDLNTTNKEEVNWNESAITGKTDAEIKQDQDNLNKNREDRISELEDITEDFQGNTNEDSDENFDENEDTEETEDTEDGDDTEETDDTEDSEESEEREEADNKPKKPTPKQLQSLRDIANKKLDNNELTKDEEKLASDFNEDFDKIYNEEKKNRENSKEEVSYGVFTMKKSNGSTTTHAVTIGDSVFDQNGEYRKIDRIFNSNGSFSVVVEGKTFSQSEFEKNFSLPYNEEDGLEKRMHNTSALEFVTQGAMWSSSASIPIVIDGNGKEINLSPEDAALARSAKMELLASHPDLDYEVVYHKSKRYFSDKIGTGEAFRHVLAIEAKSDLTGIIQSAKKGSALFNLKSKFGENVAAEMLKTLSTMGQVQDGYFKNISFSSNITMADLEAARESIFSGFNNGKDGDENRADNIKFNIAKLELLAKAIKEGGGKTGYSLGDISIVKQSKHNVSYKFKGKGKSFKSFQDAEKANGIEFNYTPHVVSIKGKDGKQYKAYAYKFRRQGEGRFAGEVIVTMPQLKSVNADKISLSEFNKLADNFLKNISKKLKGDDFLEELNRSVLMKMIVSNRLTIERLLNDPKSNTQLGDVVEITPNGYIDFKSDPKAKNRDKQKIDSAKKFYKMINDYLGAVQGRDNTIGELWLPFDERMFSILRTKAQFISHPEIFVSPEFEYDNNFKESGNESLDEVDIEDSDDAFFRTDESFNRAEGYLSEAETTKIIEAMFGEEYAKRAVEFSKDLGKKGNALVLGMMANGKIKLLLEEKGIRIKTPKHEAFHAVFGYMTNEATQKKLLDYAKEQMSLRDNIDKSKISDLDAEEWMADRYGFTSLDKIKKGKRTIFSRFVDWVADIAHKVGIFKNELDYLFWQIDRGQFRNKVIDSDLNITRYSLDEDTDVSDSDSFGTKQKYNMAYLIGKFGDVQTVDIAANFLGTQMIHNSPLGNASNIKVDSFEDAARLVRDAYQSRAERGLISKDTKLSDGRTIGEVRPKELLSIFNNPSNDRKLIIEYMLSNKNIFEALTEKIFPGIDFDTFEIHRQGEDTISDQKSLQDFRKRINNVVRFVLKRTMVYEYDKVGDNYVRKQNSKVGMIDFEAIQSVIIQASIAANRESAKAKYDPIETMKHHLMETAKKAGHDSKKGQQILSFVDSFFGLTNKSNSLVQKMLQARKDGNKKREDFISTFLNAFSSNFLSLREKSAIDFKMFGFDPDNMSIQRVAFSGATQTKFKNSMKASVDRATINPRDGQAKEYNLSNLEKKFIIDKKGVRRKSGGYIIQRANNHNDIRAKYVFSQEEGSQIKSDIKILMRALGLNSLSNAAFEFIMRDNIKDSTAHKYMDGLIRDKRDNRASDYNLKEYFADNIIKMLFALKSNESYFKELAKIQDSYADRLPADYEGSIYDYFDISEKDIFAKALKSSFAYDILNDTLRNVDEIDLNDESTYDDDKVSTYKVFKPSDFYKFFEVLGEISDHVAGSGGMPFFYRPDSKKEYVYGLSSSIFDRFANGVNGLIERILEAPKKGGLLYDLSDNGEIRSYNPLLQPGKRGVLSLESLEEIKGISQGNYRSGTTTPTAGNYLTIGLNEFLNSITSGESVSRMSFLTTNIADSGYMYVGKYVINSTQGILLNARSKDMSKARVNNSFVNDQLLAVYRGLMNEHNISNKRWDIVMGDANPEEGYENIPHNLFNNRKPYSKGSKGHQKHADINKTISELKPEEYAEFEKQILGSSMVQNFDYEFKNVNGRRVIQLGKATTGLLDVETGQSTVPIYNVKDAQRFIQLMESGDTDMATAIRRDIFKPAYERFVKNLNQKKAKISREYEIKGYNEGKFNAFTDNDILSQNREWNPVLEAYFMGYHVVNASMNALWLGSFNQYAGNSTTDISKRSSPSTTPGNTAGVINVKTNPRGMDTSLKIAIIPDHRIVGSNFSEGVYNQEIEATDGIGWANPLAYRFIDHSFGGKFGVMDKGMRKPITSYVDPHTGFAIQLKQAEHVISFNTYQKSPVGRRMMHEFLQLTDERLPKVFFDEFNKNKTQDGWEAALDAAVDFVVDNGLHKNLVWQYINASAVKTGLHKINNYDLNTGFDNIADAKTIDIDTREIRNVLNPYQDFNDNERMAPPTQMLAIMGIGTANHDRIKTVNNALAESFRQGVSKIVTQLFDGGMNKVRDLMMSAIDSMSTMGNFAEMVANDKISLNLPQMSEKAKQIVSNAITKNGQKQKYSGLRANQAPGAIFDMYVDPNGNRVFFDELEAKGVASLDENFNVVFHKEGYRRQPLLPMTEGRPAEVLMPFSQMKRFGVRANDSLNSLYTIKLNDGTENIFLRDGVLDQYMLSNLKEFVAENYDDIDVEGTPMMRALLDKTFQESLKEEQKEARRKAKEESDLDDGEVNSLEGAVEGDKTLDRRMTPEDIAALKPKVLEMIERYYNALDKSLDVVGIRIPTSNLGSGFRGRVVGFVNDMGNIVYTSELKNILDGSDYDIDQLSIFTNHINDDFTLPEENSIKGMQNAIVNAMMDVYTDMSNNQSIFVELSLKKLQDLADKVESNTQRFINDPGSASEDYTTNMQGAESIDRFANLSSAFSYLNHLSKSQVQKLLPWAEDSIFGNRVGEDSAIHSIGVFLNAALDNAKELILGRLGISKEATNVVGAMIVSGFNPEQIAEFFSNPVIRNMYEYSAIGESIEYSTADYDLYNNVIAQIENLKRTNAGDVDIDAVISDYFNLRSAIQESIEKEFDGREDIFEESSPEAKERLEHLRNLQSDMNRYNRLEALTQLKDFIEKGEILRRISHLVTLRKGYKAISSDFDFYKDTLEGYLGMTVHSYQNNKEWTKERHMAHFALNNNDYRFGRAKQRERAISLENAILNTGFNLVDVARSLPQFDQYIKVLSQLSNLYEQKFLMDHRTFKIWGQEYLKGQERTKWLSKGHRNQFYTELGKFFLAVHFKENYKNRSFDLALSESMIRFGTTLDNINIHSPEGRAMYALQFPQFVMALKNASKPSDLASNKESNYESWFDAVNGNQFIDRMTITGNDENRGFLSLMDSANISPENIYQLKAEFQRLPYQLQEMFEIYELIVNGFENHLGSIKEIMGTTALEGVSRTLDEISRKSAKQNDEIDSWKSSFLKVLPHIDGMSRYYSLKDDEAGSRRETALIKNPNGPRGGFASTVVGRLTDATTGQYDAEYLRTSLLGIPYDPGVDVTTTFEPIHGLNASEIDQLMIGGSVTKRFNHGHSYLRTTLNSDGDRVPKYYILPNGKHVIVSKSSKYSVTFAFTDDVPESSSIRLSAAKDNFGLEKKSDRLSAYSGILSLDVVDRASADNKVFIVNEPFVRPRIHNTKTSSLLTQENVFPLSFTNMIHSNPNVRLVSDSEDGSINPKYKEHIDAQIEAIKSAFDSGAEIVFPKYGAGSNEMVRARQRAPESMKYLETRLKEEFGIVFDNFKAGKESKSNTEMAAAEAWQQQHDIMTTEQSYEYDMLASDFYNYEQVNDFDSYEDLFIDENHDDDFKCRG